MFKRIVSLTLSLSFGLQQTVFAYTANLNLSGYLSQGTNPAVSDRFRPINLRYFSYQPLTNDFQILLDKGDGIVTSHKSQVTGQQLQENRPEAQDYQFKQEAIKLLDYFKIGLSLPNDKFWVNLRPDSPEEIIDPELAQTDLGKVMLEADLKLKQDTALFTSPKTPQGKAYWDKLYKKAGELFGTENITIPTLTRPWIVPGEIILRESGDATGAKGTPGAYIYKANLKVMLEEEYIKSQVTSHKSQVNLEQYSFNDPRMKELNQYSTQLIRELILPKLTQKVNSSKDYANLRQVYFSLILARWFKETFNPPPFDFAQGKPADNDLIRLIDSRNLTNLSSKQAWDKTTYFRAYQKSFKEGEYHLSETVYPHTKDFGVGVYPPTGQVIRRYMSGGLGLNNFSIHNNHEVGLYRAEEENIANSAIEARDNKALLSIEDLTEQLDIQNSAAVMAGSPIDVYLILDYSKMLSELEAEMNRLEKLRENYEDMTIYYDAHLSQIRVTVQADQKINTFHLIKNPIKALTSINRLREILKNDIESLELKQRTHPKLYDTTVQVFNLFLLKLNTLADRVKEAIRQSGSPLEIDLEKIKKVEENVIKVINETFFYFIIRPGEASEERKKIINAILSQETPALAKKDIENLINILRKEVNEKHQLDLSSLEEEWKKYPNALQGLKEKEQKEYEEFLSSLLEKKGKIKIAAALIAGRLVLEDERLPAGILSTIATALSVRISRPGEVEEIIQKIKEENKDLPSAEELLSQLDRKTQEKKIKLVLKDVTNIMKKDISPEAKTDELEELKKQLDKFNVESHGQIVEILRQINDAIKQEVRIAFIEKESRVIEDAWIKTLAEVLVVKGIAPKGWLGGVTKEAEKMAIAILNKGENIFNEAYPQKVSSSLTSTVGGIDLTKMKMLIQPQGSFASSSLDFSLPMLSRAELESFDLDKELTALQRMASSGIAPHPERFKEYLAACFAQGRTGQEIDSLKSCLEDVFEHHQLEAKETPDGYKEVLVIADTRSYVLKEGRFTASGQSSYSLN